VKRNEIRFKFLRRLAKGGELGIPKNLTQTKLVQTYLSGGENENEEDFFDN
jgi:hypothetical protein